MQWEKIKLERHTNGMALKIRDIAKIHEVEDDGQACNWQAASEGQDIPLGLVEEVDAADLAFHHDLAIDNLELERCFPRSH